MGDSWPKIKKTKSHGQIRFVVDARIRGQGERRFFEKKTDAEGWAQIQKVRRQNEGQNVFSDQELKKYGWSVQDAINFAIDRLRRQNASVLVGEV